MIFILVAVGPPPVEFICNFNFEFADEVQVSFTLLSILIRMRGDLPCSISLNVYCHIAQTAREVNDVIDDQ